MRLFFSLLILLPFFAVGQANLPYQKIVLDDADPDYGYYFAIAPEEVKGTLVLLPGFGQIAESVLVSTDLPEQAYQNGLLTIVFAGRNRMTADSVVQEKINAVLLDAKERFSLREQGIAMGGFSAGGTVALRYTQVSQQFPERFPFRVRAVFMGDSPVDLYHLWKMQEINLQDTLHAVSAEEAKFLQRELRNTYGATPAEQPELYDALSPFSLEAGRSQHEQWLKDVAVRTYHDVDINWRLKNRNQSVLYRNYVPSSELINRLMLMGNEEAEFIQTFQTGYRRGDVRHPHSWSIIDAEECVQWLLGVLNKA